MAVLWAAGATTPTTLSTTGLLAGGASAAFAINDRGEIVGEAVNHADGTAVAVYWASTTADPVPLGSLSDAGFSSAYFIGADGVIGGEAGNAAGQAQAAAWVPAAGGGFAAPLALSALTDQAASVAFGAAADGRMVGEAELESGTVHGVVWNADGSVATDLGAGTSASAINGANRLVGTTAATTGADRAAVWNAANSADTQDLAPAVSQAYGINDRTQIVGRNGVQAFVTLPQQ